MIAVSDGILGGLVAPLWLFGPLVVTIMLLNEDVHLPFEIRI